MLVTPDFGSGRKHDSLMCVCVCVCHSNYQLEEVPIVEHCVREEEHQNSLVGPASEKVRYAREAYNDRLASKTAEHILELLRNHTAAKYGKQGIHVSMGPFDIVLKEPMSHANNDSFSLSLDNTVICTRISDIHGSLMFLLERSDHEIPEHGEEEDERQASAREVVDPFLLASLVDSVRCSFCISLRRMKKKRKRIKMR